MFGHMDSWMRFMAQQIRSQQSPARVMAVADDIAAHTSNSASFSG
jgi:uncharacterized protein